MPVDYSEYPDNWHEISLFIRTHRASNRCETCGAINGSLHPVTDSKVVLTVAHINHVKMDVRYNPDRYDPKDIENNLVAECQRCHLMRDATIHAHHRKYGLPNKNQTDMFDEDEEDRMYYDMSATISDDGLYRYTLTRQWAPDCDVKRQVNFIGLNPSTADAEQDDPTIRKCVAYARRWGYEKLVMTNLFAFRAREPEDMKAHPSPIGPENDMTLSLVAAESDIVIAAWSNHGSFIDRDQLVRDLLPPMHYLKMNMTGQPAHPLYLKSTLEPTLWE